MLERFTPARWNYRVAPIAVAPARQHILRHHYMHSCIVAPSASFGLWDGTRLLGVALFGVAGSQAARAVPFGRPHARRVLELSRFHVLDDTPPNTESWFLAQALRALHRARPDLWAIMAFADPSPGAGHRGIIYRAGGGLFYGRSRPQTAYRDAAGGLHSARQGKQTLCRASALARGWTPVRQEPKYRYLFLLGSPHRRYALRRQLVAQLYPYPADSVRPTQLSLWSRLRAHGRNQYRPLSTRLYRFLSPFWGPLYHAQPAKVCDDRPAFAAGRGRDRLPPPAGGRR